MNTSSTNMKLISSPSKSLSYDVDDDIVKTLGRRVSMTSSDEESNTTPTSTINNNHDIHSSSDELESIGGDDFADHNDPLTDITFCDSFFTETEHQQQIRDDSFVSHHPFSLMGVPDAAPSSSSSEALLAKLSNDLLSSNHNIVSTVGSSTTTDESTTSKTKTKSSTTLTSKKSKSQIPAASTTVKKKKKRIVSATYKFRPYQEEKWKERFEDLLNFQKASGHCLVPHTYPENPTLARWVKRQRYQYKLFQQKEPSSMTQERIDLLHNVGFVWHSHEVVWQERLSELMEYKKQTGDCLVPSNYRPNPKLATWVKCQRRQYKLYLRGSPSNITVERIRILEKAGFEWELRSSSYSIKTQIAAHQQKVTALKNELVLPNTTIVESSTIVNT
eukprot:CAMPEP_0194231460 /NCGR_PEP_ID=MMETSP0158-20130606/199_1 /TAXON_ID=33649 /ORGANISM="Thalassionema nitzschioides, Strain L26-B" /LENGTH=388 /DNA_ID=CAMNT_0038964095 /DNA_START=149 /DNA_END=1312 /DNA_ORIENTATION=-